MNDDKKAKKVDEKIALMQVRMEEANKKVEELTEAAKRAMADLQNYKKRAEEDKQAFVKYASASVFMEILPVFDSFERAKQHLPKDLEGNEWVDGIQVIIRQFEQIMEKFQIIRMKVEGEKFDHNMHEAVLQAPGEKDIILEELEPGYVMEDQVIRPAKVKVGDGNEG